MKLDTKYKRFYTAEQAALVAVGLGHQYSNIPMHTINNRPIMAALADDKEKYNNCLDLLEEAERIKDALLGEISVAYTAINENVKAYSDTVIVLVNQQYTQPDGSNEKIPLIDNTTITGLSIAQWFYDAGFSDIAKLFDPEESYRSSKILNDALSKQNVPENLKVAVLVFKHCWENLPLGMNSPTKIQLEEFIRAEGVTKDVDIEAIIRISKPDGFQFKGGVAKPGSLKWTPLKER
jgi:hypothetical protein